MGGRFAVAYIARHASNRKGTGPARSVTLALWIAGFGWLPFLAGVAPGTDIRL